MQPQQTQRVEQTSEFVTGATTDKEIAKPSGACCLEGTIHEGEPKGTTTTIADVETYVSQPDQEKDNGHVVRAQSDRLSSN